MLNLSPGSTVTDSAGNIIQPTIIDGQETWVLTGEGQAQLDDYLNNITVTPPLNVNDNADDKFQVDVDFTAHLENGKRSEAGFGKGDDDYVSLTPVTDPAVIEIDFKAIDAEGNPTDNNPQEGSDVAINITVTSPNDGPTTLGDKLYIKLTEDGNLQVDGEQGGTLKDAGGNVLTVESIGADSDLGLTEGDYYVIDLPDGATAPHSLDLIYTPHEDKAFTDGSLTLDVTVQNNEAGDVNADGNPNWDISSGSGTGELEAINNGYDLAIGHEGDDGWVANEVVGKENQSNETGSAIQLGIKDNGLIDNDGSEHAISAMLKGVPNGFLVYVKDGDDLVLAGNAGGAAGNTWMIPLTGDGTLPEIFVLPPQNWSGTISDLELNVLSGEVGKETWGEPTKFDLVVSPVADGILSFNPAPAFGKEGDIIPLNLNIVMKDDQQVGDSDKSVETITVILKGLGKHAAFYTNGTLFDMKGDNFDYNEDEDVYTLSGLSQKDADNLGFIQTANAAKDKVTVTVETVESGNDHASGPSDSKDFDLSIFEQTTSSGDDTLLYDGDELDAGKGDDTVWLRFDENLDFGDDGSPVNLKNIEILDLTREGYDHSLIDLGADDVLAMTDDRNILTIKADEGDEISFKDGNWLLDDEKSTDDYDVYTGQSSGQDVQVHVTKDFAVSGELLDDPDTQSIEGLLGGNGTDAGGAATASAPSDSPMDHAEQSQLINDLIQQGKMMTDTL